MNHRRKKKKPKQIRKEAVQIKPIVEEKPLKKSSNKLVDILLGILLFPILIWAVLEGCTTQVSKGRLSLLSFSFS